jgi:hypothetical protein
MKRTLALAFLCAASVASADARHVMVLRAEGNADAATKTKVDTQVLKLAKNLDGNVEAGDISYGDAAAATGCSPSEAACKDDVLATMGVDELVVTSVNTVPGGTEVKVKRLAKGQPPRESSTIIPSSQPPDAKMNADVGPMFGLAAPAPAAKKEPAPAPATAAATVPQTTDKPAPTPEHAAPSPRTAQAPAPTGVTAAPNGQVAPPPDEWQPSGNQRLEITGLAVGGVLVGVGLVFWASAASQQDSINQTNPKSPKDFQNLQDLESTGDTYATLGNVMFIGGVAIAAVSGYFLWRDHKRDRAQQARIVPTVLDHGAGIALTFGGGR